jgi:hypothetical protein
MSGAAGFLTKRYSQGARGVIIRTHKFLWRQTHVDLRLPNGDYLLEVPIDYISDWHFTGTKNRIVALPANLQNQRLRQKRLSPGGRAMVSAAHRAAAPFGQVYAV